VKQHLVEFVHIRVHDGQEEEFLASRPGAVAAVAAAIPGFVAAPVIAKRGDGTWTDVWVYDSVEQAETANAKAADMPEFGRMAAVSEVVSIDMAWMPVT
jgi:antibiotic biosynthesis monooxygenase (ABM) superfamily enzyme